MNLEQIDLNLLKVFDVMMRERSVTRTAEHLGRTQSAVSHSIGKLRVLFRDDLFTRDGAAMRPTPRAVELLTDISVALATIRVSIDRHQLFEPEKTRRNFRVGLTDYHAMVIVPDLLREFSKHAPNATINVIPFTPFEIASAVYTRQLDCAITGATVKEDTRILRFELGQDPLFCAVWSGSEIAKKGITLESYLSASHLQVSADGVSSGLADTALKERGLRRNVVATISNYMILPLALRETELITHCGDGILLILDETSEVKLIPPPVPITNVCAYLLLHYLTATDPGIVWLRGIISDIYNRAQRRKKELLSRRKDTIER